MNDSKRILWNSGKEEEEEWKLLRGEKMSFRKDEWLSVVSDGRSDSLWQRVSGCGMVDRLIRVHPAWLMKFPGADLWHWVPFRGSVLRQVKGVQKRPLPIFSAFLLSTARTINIPKWHTLTLQCRCALDWKAAEPVNSHLQGGGVSAAPRLASAHPRQSPPGQQPQYWKIGMPRIGIGKQE